MTNPEVFFNAVAGIAISPEVAAIRDDYLRAFLVDYGLFWSNRFSRRKRTVMPSRVSTWLPPGTFRP